MWGSIFHDQQHNEVAGVDRLTIVRNGFARQVNGVEYRRKN